MWFLFDREELIMNFKYSLGSFCNESSIAVLYDAVKILLIYFYPSYLFPLPVSVILHSFQHYNIFFFKNENEQNDLNFNS